MCPNAVLMFFFWILIHINSGVILAPLIYLSQCTPRALINFIFFAEAQGKSIKKVSYEAVFIYLFFQ